MSMILLVEDDEALARNLSLLLKSEGFSVTIAPTQSRALAMIDAAAFTLALIDVALPGGSGFTVCTACVKAGFPAVFLTASDDEMSVVTGLNLGASDYITKPFRPMELVARLRAVLRRSGESSIEFVHGSLRINAAAGSVYKDDRELYLSALEYRLLLIFINNPSAILTRNKILSELWDASGDFVNDNTLTVYIKRLREKIEDDPANPRIILTVRGTGYRLNAKTADPKKNPDTDSGAQQ